MLAVKYREVVEKQHEMLQVVAEKISKIAHILMTVMIVLLLVIGGIGIATCFEMNQDSNDLMASVDSNYYQRSVTSFNVSHFILDMEKILSTTILIRTCPHK